MNDFPQDGRPLRLWTTGGVFEGRLRTGTLRTLDELNRGGKLFLTIDAPQSVTEPWGLEQGAISLNRDALLFVVELGSPPVLAGGQYGKFTRAGIQLRMRDFLIQGFVHVMPGGVAMKRFDHEHHPFVALTSAMLRGQDLEQTTPFVAVNRAHVIAVQAVGQSEPVDDRLSYDAHA
jgi:hypothetical protein